MSWSVNFVATSKKAAFDEIERLQKLAGWNLDQEAANAINAVLCIVPEPKEGNVLTVESSGHIDKWGGQVEVKINTHKSLVKEPDQAIEALDAIVGEYGKTEQ